MHQSLSVKGLFSIIFFSLFVVIAAGCSGSSSESNTPESAPPAAPATSAATGNVALLVTDAPSDIFEEINITVTRAEMLSDEGTATIFEGERSFNLLDLTDARIFAIGEGIAAGSYSKIRLTLSNIELVDYDDQSDPASYLKFYPNLPGNGKLDLNPRNEIEVIAGATLTIQLDLDASKSIHIVGNDRNNKYQFRPVVFITVIDSVITDRYVKLQGDIANIDTTESTFDLCNTSIPVTRDDDEEGDDDTDDSSTGCIRVSNGDTASIFDIDGMPADFTALVDGEPATVFGRLLRDPDSDDAADDDSESDESEQHDSDLDERDSDERDSDDSESDDSEQHDSDSDERELDDLVLAAALIELGPEPGFLALNGAITSIVDSSNQFTMDVAPGQGLATPLNLNVQIQDGTILINREGELVDSSAVDTGRLVRVRGVLDADDDTLFASLVIVDTDSSIKRSGTVGANPDNSCGFTLMTAEGDLSIATDSDTRAYLVEDGSSNPIDVAGLADQAADVYGNDVNGCFEAHTIIAY